MLHGFDLEQGWEADIEVIRDCEHVQTLQYITQNILKVSRPCGGISTILQKIKTQVWNSHFISFGEREQELNVIHT